MKPDETQRNAHDIARQPALRKIQLMDIKSTNQLSNGVLPTSAWLSRTLFAALLLGAGAVHAAGPQKVPTEQRVAKPYGSGFEARGLGAPQVLPVDADAGNGSSTTIQRTGQAGGSGHSGGGAGGSGRQ
ncbi:MAG TPA: hypothetical protein PLD78_15140 [Burkholderiaceae bacterium]|nr:hypothetical protein [Burkholderiaceae bacterium]